MFDKSNFLPPCILIIIDISIGMFYKTNVSKMMMMMATMMKLMMMCTIDSTEIAAPGYVDVVLVVVVVGVVVVM
jgi:hypothetical protein